MLHIVLCQRIAFCPVGAIDGRLVVYSNGCVIAFNPRDTATVNRGWGICYPRALSKEVLKVGDILGDNACEGVEWGKHFVISAGRGGSASCEVYSFSFSSPPDADFPLWAFGQWTRLGATGATGRVGCGLAVVHDRLYVSGGVDEYATGGGRFDGSVARWTGTYADLPGAPSEVLTPEDLARNSTPIIDVHKPWQEVEGLQMPTAMHAHSAITVPWLPFSA